MTQAQEYKLRHYSVSDGLAHGSVASIYQDRKGYIWFSTFEGLSRFDGYSFVNYGERDGLEQQVITNVIEDKQGRIWAATNGSGVALFLGDRQDKSVKAFKNFLITADKNAVEVKGPNQVNRILFDSQGNIYALTDRGLYRASLADPNLKFDSIHSNVDTFDCRAALADSRGSLWFGVGNELVEVRAGVVVNHGLINGNLNQELITGIVEDHDGRILVGYKFGLFEFIHTAKGQGKQWQKIKISLKPKRQINSLLVDSAGDLYIGTSGGLIKRRRNGQQNEFSSQGLDSYSVHTLYEDCDRNVWASAWTNGVYKLGSEMIVSYTNNSWSNLPVTDIVEENGLLKAVTFGGDIVEFSTGKFKTDMALDYPLTFGYSFTVRQDKDKWLSNRLGSHRARFRKPFIRLKNGRELPLTAIASISDLSKGVSYYEDKDGTIWVNKSGSDGKIYRGKFASSNKLVFENLNAEFREIGYGVQIIGDGAGGIWMATQRKLCRIRQDKFSCLQPNIGLPDIDPRSLFVDSRGWLWIGQRYKGVSVTKEPTAETPTFIHYSTANGLLSDAAWAFIEDDEGRVYVGTGKGLSRFDARNHSWQNFTQKDGLDGDQIRSFYKDKQGNIWLTAGGVTKFNPRAERKASQPPPIYISRINITGQDLPLPESGVVQIAPIRLDASRNNVTIEFVGVQFQGEDTLLYQHKLEGADADWSPQTKLRSVNYASLSAGSYRFMVRVANRDGLISQAAVFEFRILSPIYLRWWFVTIMLLLVGGMAFSLYRYRVRQLLKLERVRTRIATDLHDDIGASLSRMAILSELVQMRNEIKNNESAHMLSKIADSARELVDSMSDIVWSTDPRRDNLRSLITRTRQFALDVLESRGISWKFETPDEIDNIKLNAEQRRQIFLIFKEAINNIARHAHCERAELTLLFDGKYLEANISDDGCGFVVTPFEDQNTTNEPSGNGLKNMRERATQLNGHLEINSIAGGGTRLTMRVPVK